MRAKKFFLLTVLIAFGITIFICVNSCLFPALRCYRARQLSVLEYDGIVMGAYPLFTQSDFDLVNVSYDEKGYVYLEYTRNVENIMPISTDTFDGDFNFLVIYKYDPLCNHLIKLS